MDLLVDQHRLFGFLAFTLSKHRIEESGVADLELELFSLKGDFLGKGIQSVGQWLSQIANHGFHG